MAIQMGNDIHYIDAPDTEELVYARDEEYVNLQAEPKEHTSASIDSDYTFADEINE